MLKSEKWMVSLELWSWLIFLLSCKISSSCSSTFLCKPWITCMEKHLLLMWSQSLHSMQTDTIGYCTMSLLQLQKSSLCSIWLAVGRSAGFKLISLMMYLASTGHLWQKVSGIFPSLRSPRVRTRSISVPKGWNNSRASTPMLYMSD